MDEQAVALLQAVAKRYATLRSPAVDMTVTTEMDEQGLRNEQRSRAMYVAPNLVRTEGWRPLPSSFNPDSPCDGQGSFLFHQTAARIEAARIESAGVVRVQYGLSNRMPPWVSAARPPAFPD